MLRPRPPYLPHPIRRLARLPGVVLGRWLKNKRIFDLGSKGPKVDYAKFILDQI